MLILLARHGETNANREGRYQGQIDTVLNNRGKEQAQNLAKVLNEYPIEEVYTSDLTRAQETAAIALGSEINSFNSSPLFREYSFGVIEGLTKEEISQRYPYLYKKLINKNHSFIIPGAEDMSCLNRRLVEAEKLFRKSNKKCLLLVSHGRFINAFLSYLINSVKSPPFYFPVGNASLSVINIASNKNELLIYNDTTHINKY